jgi:hypothetical protein
MVFSASGGILSEFKSTLTWVSYNFLVNIPPGLLLSKSAYASEKSIWMGKASFFL